MPAMTIHIEADLRQKIEDYARASGMTLSQTAAQILSAWADPVMALQMAAGTAEKLAAQQRGVNDRITVIADFIADHTPRSGW